MSLLGRGGCGTVYQLNDLIALKRARQGEEEEADHANEQQIFKILEKHQPIPNIIRCFHQIPNDTFLELAPNGCIAMLLNTYQKRDWQNGKGYHVLEVTQALDLSDIHRWMHQLCLAIAALEQFGLSHCDIRPGNLLLDANWDLRLCDFDRTMEIGEHVPALSTPFGRLLNDKEGADAGSYGKAGERMDIFAIGSVYYTLLRGHEPFETEDWGTEHGVILQEKFQRREFPPLGDSASDTIVQKCWNSEHRTISEVLAVFAGMDGMRGGKTAEYSRGWLETRQIECKKLVRSGLLDSLERF